MPVTLVNADAATVPPSMNQSVSMPAPPCTVSPAVRSAVVKTKASAAEPPRTVSLPPTA